MTVKHGKPIPERMPHRESPCHRVRYRADILIHEIRRGGDAVFVRFVNRRKELIRVEAVVAARNPYGIYHSFRTSKWDGESFVLFGSNGQETWRGHP